MSKLMVIFQLDAISTFFQRWKSIEKHKNTSTFLFQFFFEFVNVEKVLRFWNWKPLENVKNLSVTRQCMEKTSKNFEKGLKNNVKVFLRFSTLFRHQNLMLIRCRIHRNYPQGGKNKQTKRTKKQNQKLVSCSNLIIENLR